MLVSRYIAKKIVKIMLLCVFVLLAVLLINQTVNLLNRASMGRLPPETVFQAIGLGVPVYLTYMVPLGLFLAIVVALGQLGESRELIAMHASGFSKWQLFLTVFVCGLVTSLVVACLTFLIAPASQSLQKTVIKRAMMQSSFDKVIPGQFQPISSDGTILHSGAKQGDSLRDVMLITPASPTQPSQLATPAWRVVHSQTAREKEIGGHLYFSFENGKRAVMQAGQPKTAIFSFKEYGFRVDMPAILTKSHRVEALSTSDLLTERHKGERYEAEWQWRFALPLSVIVFSLIAFPLSKINPRQGRLTRIIPAILFYAIYTNFLFCARSWLISHKIPASIGLWSVPFLFSVGFAIYILAVAWFRGRGWGRSC